MHRLTTPILTGLASIATVACLAACGSAASVDKGGFTSKQRVAAATAMTNLSQTSLITAAISFIYEGGPPVTCSVHIEKQKPLTFRFLIAWQGNANTKVPPEWLQALVGPGGLSKGYAFHFGTAKSLSDLRSHYGDALTKPFASCYVTNAGKFALSQV